MHYRMPSHNALLFGAVALVASVAVALQSHAQEAQTFDDLEMVRAPSIAPLSFTNGYRLEAGKRHTFTLGALPPEPELRLPVYYGKYDITEIHAEVKVGDEVVAQRSVAPALAWNYQIIDLSEWDGSDATCTVTVWCDEPFWVGRCELVSQANSQPNVLVVMVDTLRLDHLSTYGYLRDTSPRLTEFAREAVTFTQLIPSSSWTRPSVATLLTGTYPNTHGAQDRPSVLRESVPSLARTLAEGGYDTQAFFSNPNVFPDFGFGHDFERNFLVAPGDHGGRVDEVVTDRAIAALKSTGSKPWFFYVHYMGPHGPYEPVAPFDTAFRDAPRARPNLPAAQQAEVDNYDGEIAFTDVQFDRLIEAVKARGELENTIIVFTSDHGEEFWEHGMRGHGHTLFDELLRVPLVIRFPEGRHGGSEYPHLIEMVDIAPTILDGLECEMNPRFQGASYLPHLADGSPGPKTLGYANLVLDKHSMRTAKTTDLKYIEDVVLGKEWWFDLAADPGERKPIPNPGADGTALARYADQKAAESASGLHIVIMRNPDAVHTVTGHLAGDGIEGFDIQYPERPHEIRREGTRVRFSATMAPVENQEDFGHRKWPQLVEHDHARLQFDVAPMAPLQLVVTIDGKPVADTEAVVEPPLLREALQGKTVTAMDLVAEIDTYDTATLPSEFGIYAWYVPPVDTISDEELDPEMIEELRALGYIE